MKSEFETKKQLNTLKKKRGRQTKSKEKHNLNLDEKEQIMKMIKTQNFVKGYWNENEETKSIKERYKKEYDLLKGLNDKNVSDDVVLTIIIIYFIYK